MSTPSDLELVESYLGSGQDAALVQLIRRYQIPVFRHLSHELADPDDAEAVCEAVFVVAGRRLGEWSKETEFKPWLFELASEVGRSRQGEAITSDSPRLVDPSVFFRQSVHRALHSLESEDRALLVAVDLEGNSPEQVAEREDLPIERVTESLERARSVFTETLSRPESSEVDEDDRPTITVRPGEVVDNRYRVEEILGEGGMATVFRAEHVGIKRRVALKTLRPNRQAQAMIRERFVREAEVLGRLAHPNFVDVSDFGESAEGFAYLVMELLEGKPLSLELAETGPMGPKRALGILREVARGLEFAHEQGIIHRDIKPDNVVLLEDDSQAGFAKILDLGIATTAEEEGEGQPVLYGTPAYMAPEQIQGQRIDGRVDLYAAGVMLFELLTGRPPFDSSTVQYLLVRHLTETPPRLEDVLERPIDQIDEVQSLLDRCLAKDPEQRFSTAGELGQVLETLLVKLSEDAPFSRKKRAGSAASAPESNSSSIEQEGRPLGRKVLLLLVLLAPALFFVWWLTRVS